MNTTVKRTILGFFISLFVFFPAYVLIPIDVYASSDVCYCVLYLRQELGVDIRGNANTIKANIPVNQIKEGDVVLFSYEKVDHVALISDIIQATYPSRPEIYITIEESNFHHCKKSTRTIPLNDPAIRGIYRPEISPLLTVLGL